MGSAYFQHVIWAPDTAKATVAGSVVTMTYNTIDTTPAAVAAGLQALWSTIDPTITVTHAKATGYFTIAASGVIAITLMGQLAELLGFSSGTLAGAASYTSDQRPSPWFAPILPADHVVPGWYWRRKSARRRGGDRYLGVVMGSYGEQLEITQPILQSEWAAWKAWVRRALAGARKLSVWLDTSSDTTWDATHFWRLRDDCLLLADGLEHQRESGSIRRLYSYPLLVEVF
jgi:hypothetical protein